MEQIDFDLVKPYIILLAPVLWGILEGIKRAGVDKKWIPFVNAALSLLAGGGVALIERQDLIPAVAQVAILFFGAAGIHDRTEKIIKKLAEVKEVETAQLAQGKLFLEVDKEWNQAKEVDPAYYTQGSEDK